MGQLTWLIILSVCAGGCSDASPDQATDVAVVNSSPSRDSGIEPTLVPDGTQLLAQVDASTSHVDEGIDKSTRNTPEPEAKGETLSGPPNIFTLPLAKWPQRLRGLAAKLVGAVRVKVGADLQRLSHASAIHDFESLSWLSVASGQQVYLSGPHEKKFVNNELKTFGHYNPAFVDWLVTLLPQGNMENRRWFPASGESTLFRATRLLYAVSMSGDDLKPRARLFHIVKRMMKLAPTCVEREQSQYLEAMGSGIRKFHHRWRDFTDEGFCPSSEWRRMVVLSRLHSSTLDNPDDLAQAVGFWLRRRIDKTGPRFEILLERVLQIYDTHWWNFVTDTAQVIEARRRMSVSANAAPLGTGGVAQTLKVGDWELAHSSEFGIAKHPRSGRVVRLWGLADEDQEEGCEASSRGALLSIVGTVVSYFDSSGGYCEGAAHGWAVQSYRSFDFALRKAKRAQKGAMEVPGTSTQRNGSKNQRKFSKKHEPTGPVQLKHFFEPAEVERALKKHPFMLRAHKEGLFDCSVVMPTSESETFAFDAMDGEMATITLGQGHACEVDRGAFTPITMTLKLRPEHREAVKAAQRNGLLRPALKAGESTGPTTLSPQIFRVGGWHLYHDAIRGMLFEPVSGFSRDLWLPMDHDGNPDCVDHGSWGRLVSVVGDYLALEQADRGYCPDVDLKHGYLTIRIPTVDEREVEAVRLNELFGEKQVDAALARDSWLNAERPSSNCRYDKPENSSCSFALKAHDRGRTAVYLGVTEKCYSAEGESEPETRMINLGLLLKPKKGIDLKNELKRAKALGLLPAQLRAPERYHPLTGRMEK